MNKLIISILLIFSVSLNSFAQQKNRKFQYFGGFGLSINEQFFSFSIQPGLLYNVSKKFKIGVALQYSYAKSYKSYYGVNFRRHMFGGNFLTMYYPISSVELSAEYGLLKINEIYNSVHNIYITPALFGSVGYRSKNFAIGFKFDFLHNNKSIYKDALIPYVRIYF